MNSAIRIVNDDMPHDQAMDCIPCRRFYKNQPSIDSEATLRFKPLSDSSLLTFLLREGESSLRNLLVAAGIMTEEQLASLVELTSVNKISLVSLLEIGCYLSRRISVSFSSLSAKVDDRTISFQEAVVAANYLFVTGGFLGDALVLVGKPRAYSVIDFLNDVGCLPNSSNEVFISSVKFITKRLLQADEIDESTLRVATRLRYVVSMGRVTFACALKTFKLFQSEGVEPEENFKFLGVEI